jgi:hypothetical protein
MGITPIFILSSPRSGSTLLQRVLAAHADVATTSEPWILLPFLAPLRPDLPGASHRDELVSEAVEDFVRELPDRRRDYLAAVRTAALQLYERAAPGEARWFVDKSPIYHLVVDELVEAFPDGRFVFLWRNPLAVLASAVELFGQGRWEADRYTLALFQSIEDLVPASVRFASVAHAVRYEDLVRGDEATWSALTEYIGMPFDRSAIERFTEVELHGRKGDQLGPARFDSLSTEPLDKWRLVVNNPVRRAWARRYLRWIGPERLAQMGYDLDELMAELGRLDIGTAGAAEDLMRIGASMLREAGKLATPAHGGERGAWNRLARPADRGS